MLTSKIIIPFHCVCVQERFDLFNATDNRLRMCWISIFVYDFCNRFATYRNIVIFRYLRLCQL